MESLELLEVSKFYSNGNNTNKGLDGVSIKFARGEFVAITGESGSGKTTLLNVASTLMEIDQGDILIDGKDTYDWSEDTKLNFRRNNIGFVFQEYNIIPGISALDNVLLALYNIGYDKKEAKEKALKALNDVGLQGEIYKKTSILSGGERQRVVIARALASDCSFLAIDEPTGNLDSKTGKEIIQLIKNFSKDKLVLYVTHDYDSIKDLATRHVELRDGKVVKDEALRKPDEITPSENLNRKPVHVIKSSMKILFSSLGRFFVLTLSLVLFALASMGISFAMNYSEDLPLFNFIGQRNYYNFPDENSLLLLPKATDAIDLNEFTFDDSVVDEGDITSMAALTYPGFSSASAYGDFTAEENFKMLLNIQDASEYERVYTDDSVQEGLDLYVSVGWFLDRFTLPDLRTKINDFFPSNRPSVFFDSNLTPLNNDQLNGVGEFIELNDYLRNLRVKNVYVKGNQYSTSLSFFKPSSTKVYREFLSYYSRAYMKGFSLEDSQSTNPINMMAYPLAQDEDGQIQFFFDGKPLSVVQRNSTADAPPFVFPSTLANEKDKIRIRFFEKELSFSEYLTTLNSKLNKTYTDGVYTVRSDVAATPEEQRMSFSSEVGDAVVFQGLSSGVGHPSTLTFAALHNVFQSRIRIYNQEKGVIDTLHNDLKDRGMESEVLSKLAPLQGYDQIYNNLMLGLKLMFYVGVLLIYLFFVMITGKIEKNLTKNFDKDDHVLITLGYSRKSRLITKTVILIVPTFLTTMVTFILLSSIVSVLGTIAILPYLYIYIIFLIANLLFSSSMAYKWQKRAGGF